MPKSPSLADLPLDLQELILAKVVGHSYVTHLSTTPIDSDDRESWCKLQSFLHLRVVCSGWRSLLESLRMPVVSLNLNSHAVPVCGLAAVPVQFESLQVRVKCTSECTKEAVKSLEWLLASKSFQRHSTLALCDIDSPALTLIADSAAAFSQLHRVERLNARALTPQLPPCLRRLALEGDAEQLSSVPPGLLSPLTQLETLTLCNVAADIAQLPRSLYSVTLTNVDPGPTFHRALRDAAHRLPAEVTRRIWKEHPDGRLVAHCTVCPERGNASRFVVTDVFILDGEWIDETDEARNWSVEKCQRRLPESKCLQ